MTGVEVEAKALHYLRAPGIYNSDLQVNQLQHKAVAEWALQFRPQGRPASEMLKYVDLHGSAGSCKCST